jgi:nitroreductase
MENSTITVLKQRRSCKSFVPRKHLDWNVLRTILEAGTYAPSSMGRQSAVMVVVEEPSLRDQLSIMNAAVDGRSGDPFYHAPTLVIVFAKGERIREDGSVVMANLLTAAAALDVGACWIHRAEQMFQTEEGRMLMKKWGLTEDYVGVAVCALGYPAQPPKAAAPRKPDYIRWDNLP